ncbi:MAG: PKD domain-containing protein [Flavobacteriales bacterium]
MRAILTPLFIFATLFAWGQETELPMMQTPASVIAEAVDAWEQGQLSMEIEASISPEQLASTWEIALTQARDNRATVNSVQRGIWSETSTWDCGCIPAAGDNVFVDHEVSLVENAEFGSLLVRASGSLIDLNDVTMTFDGNMIAAGAASLEGVTLIANGIGADQTLDGEMTVDRMLAQNRSNVTVAGTVEITGHLEADDSAIAVDAEGTLILSENEAGRATVLRSNGGSVDGLVTRKITLPAIPNRNMTLVEQRITVGLEGVTVNELLGDFPTVGFVGADDPEGFPNIAFWSADAAYNYQSISSVDDVLPVWEGVYLALAPAELYTLTFAGTLPDSNIEISIPGDSFTALFGNPTNGNVGLQDLDDVFGESKFSLDCWNTATLQYDSYVSSMSTNGMQNTMQPNTTCQFLPTEDISFEMNADQTLANGTFANLDVELNGYISISVENTTGYYDECLVTLREGMSTSFDPTEDAINTSSLFSACDVYLRDGNGTRSSIAQMNFDSEPVMSFEVVVGANRPVDGNYTLTVNESDWEGGCLQFLPVGETEIQPLEPGFLAAIELSSTANHNHAVGTLFLVPNARAEVTSPGCEGLGETAIEVFPTGDGPWTVALNDTEGNSFEGALTDNGVTTMFSNLPTGTYTYAILNDGNMTCGEQTGEHTVIRPLEMDLSAEITHDCGDGGAVVAVAEGGVEPVVYTWTHGIEGAMISGLNDGTYTFVVTDAFACADTMAVNVLKAPELSMLSTDGACDGSTDAAIELNSDDDTSLWNFDVRNANGDLVDFAYNVSTPAFFDVLATGTYNVEAQILGEYGCEPETREATVVQPVPMTLTASSETQCDEATLGSATAALVGGLGNTTFTWSDGTQGANLTEASAGTYTVTVTDEAGCTESLDVEVTMSPQLDVTVMSPGCEGEGETGFQMNGAADVTWTVVLADASGMDIQTMTLENGNAEIGGLASGDYTLTYSHDVEDGCPAKSVEATLTVASNLVVDVTTTPMECGDVNTAAIDLTVHGGVGNVTVTWDHGAQGTELANLAGGQYYAVVADDNGCTKDVRVEVEETPTVVADFVAPMGGLTDGTNGMTLTFTNTSEGNIAGQTWYFGDTETPSYDFHATHTFEEAGAYDVFLNVWNDRCSHTVRKTVVVTEGESNPNNDELGTLVTNVMEGDLTDIHAPVTTESGWMMNLGAAANGMKIHVFDLTGRQLCNPVAPDANGQIWVEGDQWPALVLLRLVHEPTNSIRTWKMVR